MPTVHTPVLLAEAIEHLNIQPDGIYVDATFGGGGHSREIISRLGSEGKLLVIDRNPAAVALAQEMAGDYRSDNQPTMLVAEGNFSDIERLVSQLSNRYISGVLFDLGLSSDLLVSARGFSFQEDAPLDMRFEGTGELTAADILETMDADDLANVFHQFGEFPHNRKLARSIVAARELGAIRTTTQLYDLIKSTFGSPLNPQRIAAQVFQALRIVVNREFESLQSGLLGATNLLQSGGKIVVISFHSLEDRLVKRFFRRHAGKCTCFKSPELCHCEIYNDLSILTSKAVVAGYKEKKTNPRARSAKLRAAEKR